MSEPADEIGFEGDDEMDQATRSHMLDAFAHKAGHGPHPGKKPHELNYDKMQAAARGGDAATDLGPGQFDTQQAQQTQALGQQQDLQGAQQAQQAQAGQAPVNAPVEAPGPQGESMPYPAQKKQPPGPGGPPPAPGGQPG